MSSEPVIIEVSLNGEPRPAANPNVPRTPHEIAADVRRCLDSGASILHNHNDDPNVGGTGVHDPQPYRDTWAPLLGERPGLLWYPTMEGGGPGTTIEGRASHLQALADDDLLKLSIVDMGTSNMGRVEADGAPTRSDALFINTNGDAHYMFEFCRRNKVGASIGIIEAGFLRVALAFWRAGLIPQGSMIRMMFGGAGALAGLPPTPAALDLCLGMLEEINLPWEVATFGGNPVKNGLASAAIARGGHVRLGLEDCGATETELTNAELVESIVVLINAMGREPATPQQAAEILDLPPASDK